MCDVDRKRLYFGCSLYAISTTPSGDGDGRYRHIGTANGNVNGNR